LLPGRIRVRSRLHPPGRGRIHGSRDGGLHGGLFSHRYGAPRRRERFQVAGDAPDRHRSDGLSRKLLLPHPARPARARLRESGRGVKRLLDRVGTLLKKGAGVALAPAPDPRVTQLTSHQRQRALLNQVVKAGFSAAEAQVRINEAMTGVSQDFADLTATLHRAEQTTEDMQARATAIDRLVRDGDLDAISFAAGFDSVDARFQTLGAGAE